MKRKAQPQLPEPQREFRFHSMTPDQTKRRPKRIRPADDEPLQKFQGIAYDTDQQQTFFPAVAAKTEREALEIVGNMFPFAQPVGAVTLKELRQMANNLERRSLKGIVRLQKKITAMNQND